MKKILFIVISSGVAASTRVRVSNLTPELEKYGFETRTVLYPKSLNQKWQLLRLCKQFDVVFLQKRTPPLFFAWMLRKSAKKLVYDFDDAIYYRPNDPDETKDPQRLMRFVNIVRKADLVIAGNSILAEEAQHYTSRCLVLASAVETRGVPVKDYQTRNDKFVIGWVGGNLNLPCLEKLRPVFRRLAERHAIQLRIISGRPIDVPGVDSRFIPWDAKTQEKEIACFDVGVMPLFDYPHTRGKCAYKALQYMAAGVPAVVSDVGINNKVVEHGASGFVVSSFDDFSDAIEKLIEDRELQQILGEHARRRAEELFSIESIGKTLAAKLADL